MEVQGAHDDAYGPGDRRRRGVALVGSRGTERKEAQREFNPGTAERQISQIQVCDTHVTTDWAVVWYGLV